MAIKQGMRMTHVAIINDAEAKNVDLGTVEGNTELMGITFNLLKPPETVLSSNFKELVMLAKEASVTTLSEEEISKLLSHPRETIAKLAYIVVSRSRGVIFGFVIDGVLHSIIIPRGAGDIDCLIEVITDNDSDEASCFVDCTNTKIFTPDQMSGRYR